MKKGFESSCGKFIPISMDWFKGKLEPENLLYLMGKSMVSG